MLTHDDSFEDNDTELIINSISKLSKNLEKQIINLSFVKEWYFN